MLGQNSEPELKNSIFKAQKSSAYMRITQLCPDVGKSSRTRAALADAWHGEQIKALAYYDAGQ